MFEHASFCRPRSITTLRGAAEIRHAVRTFSSFSAVAYSARTARRTLSTSGDRVSAALKLSKKTAFKNYDLPFFADSVLSVQRFTKIRVKKKGHDHCRHGVKMIQNET